MSMRSSGIGTSARRLRHSLFREARPGFLDLTAEPSAINSAIQEHPEFVAFVERMSAHFNAWRQESADFAEGATARRIALAR